MQGQDKQIAADDLIERRQADDVSRIVQNGIAMADLHGADEGAKYLREREIPISVAARVIGKRQRRAEDWA